MTDAAVVLVGCVKTKLTRPAPAQELYRSTVFTRRRDYAERSGRPWYLVSSRWGLLRPDEVAAPYDLYLGDQPPSYRRAWGEFVAAQLELAMPLPRGALVEVHAGDAYVSALEPALSRRGLRVLDAVQATSMGGTLAWYAQAAAARPLDLSISEEATPGPATQQLIAQPVKDVSAQAASALEGGPSPHDPLETLAEAAALVLGDGSRSISVAELRSSQRRLLESPGLYSWWVDAQVLRTSAADSTTESRKD